MAIMKSVYFSEIHPNKWFKTRDEAEKYDALQEMIQHVENNWKYSINKDHLEELIQVLCDRYTIEQRWDWPNITSEEILKNGDNHGNEI